MLLNWYEFHSAVREKGWCWWCQMYAPKNDVVVLFCGTGAAAATSLPDHFHQHIESRGLSPTVAGGVATAYPIQRLSRAALLTSARKALPKRKEKNRNPLVIPDSYS